jgi:predicted RecB family nuclease
VRAALRRHDRMRARGTTIELSASDLSQFLGCRHRTGLDLAVARGLRPAPNWLDPALAVLQQRGLEHERRHVNTLRAEGLEVVDLSEGPVDEAVEKSINAMRAGVDVIVQAALRDGRWFGRPDVLRRVANPSSLGAWSYEVLDTKLAKEARGGTVLQLSLYSELVRVVQATLPEFFHVVTPDPARPVKTFRVQDFAAYFRFVRARLEATTALDADEITASNCPEPVEHCDVCRWWATCDRRRRDDDHLCLVAGISRMQTRELEATGVTTLAALGSMPLPLPFVPQRGGPDTYVRVREQARLQLEGRTRGKPVHELLAITVDHGLARLPSPSSADVFLDLEGDPFAREGGREYLFGLVTTGTDGNPRYWKRWAYTDRDERSAFETVVDLILDSWTKNPSMHVYHYAPYEPAAFKRLMGRYSTREAEIDRMLRAALFVDLYSIVKHSLRASVEKYSIKDLEPFYSFVRAVPLELARTSLRVVERALELGAVDAITADARAGVEGYNKDDCVSVLRLQQWLEELRATVERNGTVIPRPVLPDPPEQKELSDRARRVQEMIATLTAGVPPDAVERTDDENGRWLLAHLLEWHRREAKAPWWEFFRLRDLSEEELLDESAAVSGMRLVSRVGGTQRSPVDRYAYPPQETEVGEGDLLHLPDGADFGTVDAIDLVALTFDVKKRGAQADVHPTAAFAHSVVNTSVLADALFRLAEDVVHRGIGAAGPLKAARELLLRRRPRLRTGPFRASAGENAVDFAVRIAGEIDETILPIQGPPGAGKTHTAARMICELVRLGKRVGVSAVSHKVIRNLLEASLRAAAERGLELQCAHKVTTKGGAPSPIQEFTDNAELLSRVQDGRVHVAGGTAWLWARPDARAAVDVLFVDEAGQMSLANVLAVSQAASSAVLLGDPQQLEQPQQGSHPDGTNVSALEHVLEGHKTIPSDRGMFLPETWRLAPSICAFTSDLFYEGRLGPRAGLERQELVGVPPFEGAGLWICRVPHEGNQSSSREEADAVDRVVSRLLTPGARWIDREGAVHDLTSNDVLVVAPYNAHVALLSERLSPRGVRVGTVDRFQGQEAPVVIYSMATSTPEEAPHGMEFLYSLNRLNVATSRARCACILVASPRLFEAECRSPRQMQLANAFCRYVELARPVDLTGPPGARS